MVSIKSRLLHVLFWSVISAAFIGPGTLATAAAAGASYQFKLIWALVFATVACIVLQEMSARITIASGKNISKTIGTGSRPWLIYFIAISVVIGCAAYEAGNILGALAGIEMIFDINRRVVTAALGVICGLILWGGNIKQIANVLGVLVAVMGIAFIFVAAQLDFGFHDFVGGLIPAIPEGAEWLIVGLLGTTIVPYNLFLGSGISVGRTISDMRFGLIVSVFFGGVISIAILLVGTQLNGTMSFENLANVVGDEIGNRAKGLIAVGLFAAGFTSSITAALAAGILLKSLFHDSVKVYRYGWILVLGTGLIFGISEVRPIPVIIAAQVLNGMILPLVTIFLIIQANNRMLVTGKYLNGLYFNILSFILLNLVLIIGLNNVLKALYDVTGGELSNNVWRFAYLELFSLPVMVFTLVKVRNLRRI